MPRWATSEAERARIKRLLVDAPMAEDVIIFLNDGSVVRGLLEGSGLEFDVPHNPAADPRIRGFFRMILDDGAVCEVDVLDVLRIRPRPDR